MQYVTNKEGMESFDKALKEQVILTADKIKEVLNADDYEYYNIKDGIKVPIPKSNIREEKLNEPHI
tara:strand:- start:12931 stop:13128 length:198 start_codon:yes stop_codon:yes gene_type:complete